MSAKVLTIWFEKGGTGKTTVSFNLAAGLRKAGKRVLLIDIDPAGGSTKYAGFDPALENKCLSEILLMLMAHREIPMDEFIRSTDEIDIILSNGMLEAVEGSIKSVFGDKCVDILNYVIDPIRDQYDYIVIDGSPGKSIYNLSALNASDEVIMPMRANFLDFKGIEDAEEAIISIKERNPKMKVRGILITQYRKTKHSELILNVMDGFQERGIPILKPQISYGVDVVQASLQAQSIFAYKMWSKQAKEFKHLVEVILHG